MPSPSPGFARYLCGSVAMALLLLPWATRANAQNTIQVPANQPTIQAAIDAANNGDTVLVAPGTYAENINLKGKAITVTSSGGPAVTTINGGAAGSVVIFNTNEGLGSVLRGFTITNGKTSGVPSYDGGGVYISNASPTIRGNVIVQNVACGNGGGIAAGFSSALIQGNTISNNSQGSCSGGDGGGIYVGGAGSVQIIGNTISNNFWNSGNGGGIALFAAGTPTIENNTISGNTATGLSPASQGGGIYVVNDSDALILQNLIVGNNAGQGGFNTGGQGGGIAFSVPSSSRGPLLINNTIANNGGAGGSGIFAGGFDSQSQIVNNVIVASPGQPALFCDTTYSQTPPTLQSNDAFSFGGTGFGGSCASLAGSAGNISVDPLFINPSSDQRLQSSSPAVDTGSNSAPGLPSTDLDGNPRIVDGNGDGFPVVDMGVYELQPTTITLTPSSLTFNPQPVGTTSSPQTATLINTGANKLFLSLSTSAPFSETDNCGGAVPAGASCSISITFAPASTGTFAGGITLRDNAPQNPQTLGLTGTGGVPVAALAPASLFFNGQAVGSSSPAQTVTLSNTGDGPLAISAITATGDFSQTGNCSNSLAAGASCSISVSFTPAAGGTRQGTLTVTDNASVSPQIVSLTGTGLTAIGVLAPASLSFGNQAIGASSAGQTATFSNTGGLSLNIASIAISGRFSQTNNCGSTVAPGSSCAISVAFSPVAIGAASGSLTVTDAGGKTYISMLSGTGVDFAISASPGSVTVVRGSSATYMVSLTPVGGSFGSSISFSCAGLPTGSTCSFSPPSAVPGTGGTISVMTVPTNQPTTPTGTFTITITGQSGALSHSTQVKLTVNKKK